MEFTLSINMDNDAFEDNSVEIARILREAADKVEGNVESIGYLRDYNGNTVGKFDVTEEA